MNKKLMALLVALTVAPLTQAVAVEWKANAKAVGTALGYNYDNGNKDWKNIALRGVPALTATVALPIVTYYASKDSQKVVDIFKAIKSFDKAAISEYLASDKLLTLAALSLTVAGALGVAGGLWDGGAYAYGKWFSGSNGGNGGENGGGNEGENGENGNK